MGWREVSPETLEERLIYWTIVGTWGLWLLGALYVVGPLLGYSLIAIILCRWLGLLAEKPAVLTHISPGVVLWAVGMLAMLLALVIGHLDHELGLDQMLKSTAGWFKGWALLAVFVLAGAAMRVRPAVVYRAMAIFALQTLVLAPLLWAAAMLSLPPELYVSPLSAVGGPGPEFFDVTLYSIDNTTQRTRWRFFAPWATAAAFVASIGFVFALYDRSRLWKIVGLISAVVVCWMAESRTSIVALPMIVVLVLLVSNVRRPVVLIALGLSAALLVLVSDEVVLAYEEMQDAFNSARAASSRVRATLASMAYHRWLTEAPVFGHGIVERGPHLVQFMPIGSHHTWLGLLFVKGGVGFLGLALPLAWSIVELSVKAQTDRTARAGLGVLLAMLLFSFGDNIEIIAYLVWPAMIVVGIAHRHRYRSPLAATLGSGRG